MTMEEKDTGVIFAPWLPETAETIITHPIKEELKDKTVPSEYYGEIIVRSENYIG